ncbi:hypothetical protein CVT24_008578 [Panaeolus cyanescens]|uniref:Uncharacterized protein n=1 Tax=Panaeolus cyanescens TaxID=181874 RepID=A0A409VKT3_9AGAR|nr:hypothetical protein CVT24_008578 [Panaeolus cyanescens]
MEPSNIHDACSLRNAAGNNFKLATVGIVVAASRQSVTAVQEFGKEPDHKQRWSPTFTSTPLAKNGHQSP